MRKQTITSLICLAVTLALLISCAANGNESATVRFYIGEDRNRTIGPEDAVVRVESYRFTLDNGTSEIVQTIAAKDSDSYELTGIVPGSYSVTVDALNSSEDVLATATSSYRFLPGLNSYSVTLETLKGSGNLSIGFTWDTAIFMDNENQAIKPTFEIKLTTQAGSQVAIAEGDFAYGTTAGTATLTKNGLASGSYLLNVIIMNGTTYVTGCTEVIRIADDTTSTGTIALNAKKQISVKGCSINDLTSAPIKATIVPSRTYEPGDTLDTTTTFNLTFDYLPHGVDAKDVTVKWYNEDMYVSNKKSDVTFITSGGITRITAVYQCEKLGSMGSTSIDFYFPAAD